MVHQKLMSETKKGLNHREGCGLYHQLILLMYNFRSMRSVLERSVENNINEKMQEHFRKLLSQDQ